MPDFQSLIERKLEPTGVSNNDVIYRCPKCEVNEGSGHLYVNYDKEKFHCFKCGYKGRRMEALLKDLHIDILYDYSKLYSERDKELDDIITAPAVKEEKLVDYSTNLQTLKKYYDLHTTQLSLQAYTYLINRGLTDKLIYDLGIREGVNRYGEIFKIDYSEYVGRDYSGRVMIPSLKKSGGISFYLGRDYIGDKDARYMNPPKELAAASEDVWDIDLVESDSVIICEGVMTAIAVNKALGKFSAVATYGKSIAQRSSNDTSYVTSQGEKLLSREFKSYIIFYDKDAKKEAHTTAKYLYDRGANVRIVNIPEDMYGEHADAADMTQEEVIACIKESITYDRFIDVF